MGNEWKYSFQRLMIPYIRPEIFPSQLAPLLARHFKTTTVAVIQLCALNSSTQNDKNYIFEIPYGVFRIDGKIF
jgi:hypothetical protein